MDNLLKNIIIESEKFDIKMSDKIDKKFKKTYQSICATIFIKKNNIEDSTKPINAYIYAKYIKECNTYNHYLYIEYFDATELCLEDHPKNAKNKIAIIAYKVSKEHQKFFKQ
jgi:hypothetical protein